MGKAYHVNTACLGWERGVPKSDDHYPNLCVSCAYTQHGQKHQFQSVQRTKLNLSCGGPRRMGLGALVELRRIMPSTHYYCMQPGYLHTVFVRRY